MTIKDRINHLKATTPAFNTPHQCPMCGTQTSWEKRQQWASKLQIFGHTIGELKAVIEWAYKNGYHK